MAFLFICLFGTASAQTVGKTFTIIPFADANTNCAYDAGETILKNCPMQISAMPCYNMGSSMASDCSGMAIGTMTVPVSCTSYSIQDIPLGNFFESCATYSNIPYGTVYYLPLKPSVLNSALFSQGYNFVCNNQYVNTFNDNSFDTVKTCNRINAQVVLGQVRNQTVCYTLYTGTLSVKIDGVTYDSFAITGNLNNFVSTTAAGSFTVNNNIYETDFNYNFASTATLASGNHTVSVELSPLAGYSQPSKMQNLLMVDSCGQLAGNAYVDCNNNCVKNPGETYGTYPISYITLSNSSNSSVAYPDFNGDYTINTPAGIYTLTPYANPGFSLCSTAPSTLNVVNTATLSYNYGLKQAGTITDDYAAFTMLTNGVPGPGAVPGGSFDITVINYMTFANTCGLSVPPSKLKVVLPPQVTYVSALPGYLAPTSVIAAASGDTLVWTNPGTNSTHKVRVSVGTGVTMGSSYCVQGIIYPLADGYPGNNIHSVCNVYGGPYDPNSKTSEAPGMNAMGDIPPTTQDLTYTIEFQNLGTGPAVNVNINDTIDAQLDLSSFEVLSSSFPVQAQINALSRAVDFKFRNINLPAAVSNEPASHGFVRYKVKLNSSLPVGTQIKNRAHIYFDYNSAINTNTTKNTIVSVVTSINEQSASAASVFPNPVKDNVFIKGVSVREVKVTDILGHEVRTVSNSNVIDMQELGEGVYFLRITDLKNNTTVVKIVRAD
ncbi:MAG: DUF7619 domain-containing protein [Bacteroidia bacterium]